MEEKENQAVVIDNGSCKCKAGFAGQDLPSSYLATITGRPKYNLVMANENKKTCYIGDEAQTYRGILSLRCPIENGIITNWEDMTEIWNYIFSNELRTRSDQQSVLITDTSFDSSDNRDKIAEILFEKFNVPYLCIANQAVLNLYSTAQVTGIVIDSGESLTNIVPIIDNQVIKENVVELKLAGKELTDYLVKLLNQSGYSFFSSSEREIVRDIKNKLCFIVSDFDLMCKEPSLIEKSYQLPDGQLIYIRNELIQCPEALFRPSVLGFHFKGIHNLLYESILDFDKEIQNIMYENILLSGGSTLFPGFSSRILKEITKNSPELRTIKVNMPEYPRYSAWIGGSVLASLSNFEDFCVSQKEYQETGVSKFYL